MNLIVIDPGHGGADGGATGNGLKEKDITLVLAFKIYTFLVDNYEVNVKLTREKDIFVSLAERAKIANELKATYFCSIHVNSGGEGKASGFESFIYFESEIKTEGLRQSLHTEIASFYKSQGLPDRGMKKANFAVLRETTMPACLLENLFIDNVCDAAKLKEESFQDVLAKVIAKGLAVALKLKMKQTAKSPPIWNPVAEIEKLKKEGLILEDHMPDEKVTWGELATVLNRLLDNLRVNFQ